MLPEGNCSERVAAWLQEIQLRGFVDPSIEEDCGIDDIDDGNDITNGSFEGKTQFTARNDFIVHDPIEELSEDQGIEDVDCHENDNESLDGTTTTSKIARVRGCCSVQLRNGLHVSGNFRKRRRVGPGLLYGPGLEQRRGVHSIWGFYKAGVLTGLGRARLLPKGHSKDILFDGIVLEGPFVRGRLHGLVRGLSFKDGSLLWVGKFVSGRPVGNCWMAVQGDGWQYGTLEPTTGRFGGPANAFIYPDLSTVLLGEFRSDVMVSARESRITGVSFKDRVLQLQFDASLETSPEYRYWPSTLTSVGCPWKLQDPYERKMVFSGSSGYSHNFLWTIGESRFFEVFFAPFLFNCGDAYSSSFHTKCASKKEASWITEIVRYFLNIAKISRH